MQITTYHIKKLRKILKEKVEDLKEVIIDTESALDGACITEEYRRRKANNYTRLRAEIDTILWTVSSLGISQEFTPEKCGFDWTGTIL